jgi:hypothetical protein
VDISSQLLHIKVHETIHTTGDDFVQNGGGEGGLVSKLPCHNRYLPRQIFQRIEKGAVSHGFSYSQGLWGIKASYAELFV